MLAAGLSDTKESTQQQVKTAAELAAARLADVATQATLVAVLNKLSSDPATQAAQATSNASLDSIDSKLPAMHEGLLPVVPSNITSKFREAFEVYVPNGGGKWLETKHASDIVAPDGNAAAASYLVISKSPLVAGAETLVETVANFDMPVELAIGASFSQRTLGQEFSVELVDTGTPLPDVADLAISAISQATTTLTVDTTSPHGLSVGKSIGIRDCSDLRANYPALVVASAPSPNQFTCTAGPAGTIASQTIANPAGAKGFVFFRERLGRAQNGVSQIFETAGTNASLYVRSESGDALPSGTIAGAHPVAVASVTSTQLVNSPFTYAFAPASVFGVNVQADRVQWSDIPVDSAAQATNRLIRTQVCPDPSATYKLRIRATNNKNLTVPVAQIVSAIKTGTTTATINTDVPHGLAAGDPAVVYGIRDQSASAFPNLLAATAVASIVSPTAFTIVIGTAATITSYGGYVAKVQGGNLMSALGASAVVAQSATLTTLTDGTRQLVLQGNTNWAALLIGDGVELVGVRDNTSGATLGIDGAWKVANVVAANLTLVPMPGNTPPANFALTNCGGGVIKRTEMRVSFIRVFDFERQRFEMLARPAGDLSAAAPVTVQGGTVAATGTGGNTAGTAAEDAAASGNPVLVGGVVRTAVAPTTLVAGDVARATMTLGAATVFKPYGVAETGWNASLALTTATAAPIQAAAGASLKRHITALQAINTGASAVDLILLDGATERWRITLPVNVPVSITFPTELVATANTALNANLSAVGTVRANFQGYTSA